MDINLTKEQSLKADSFMKMLLPDNALTQEEVYEFFNDKDLANAICDILESKGLINLLAKGENIHFGIITPNNGLSTFLKNGGLTKIANDEGKKLEKEMLEEQIRKLTRDNLRLGNWDIRFRWLIASITFIIGFTIKYLMDI